MLETLFHENPIGIFVCQRPNYIADMASNVSFIRAFSIRYHKLIPSSRKLCEARNSLIGPGLSSSPSPIG